MPSPTLIASYAVYSAGADTGNLTTPIFTPSNGEVIIVKPATWDTNNPMGAVSGGSQNYLAPITAAPGGFNCWCRIAATTIDTSLIGGNGSMAVTVAGTASASRHSIVVERWTGRLAGSPAVNATINGSGAPAANITTIADGSALSWVSADVQSIDPATRGYLLSATEDGLYNGVGGNSVQYFAYAIVGAAGSYTIGMSAPGSQKWVMAGIEILGPVPPGTPGLDWEAGMPEARWSTSGPESAWTIDRPGTRWEAGPPDA